MIVRNQLPPSKKQQLTLPISMKKSKEKKKERKKSNKQKNKEKGCQFVTVLPKEETGTVWGHRLHCMAFKPGR